MTLLYSAGDIWNERSETLSDIVELLVVMLKLPIASHGVDPFLSASLSSTETSMT